MPLVNKPRPGSTARPCRSTLATQRTQRPAEAGHNGIPSPFLSKRIYQIEAVNCSGVIREITPAIVDGVFGFFRDCKEGGRDPLIIQSGARTSQIGSEVSSRS